MHVQVPVSLVCILLCIGRTAFAYEPGMGIGAQSHSSGQTRLFFSDPWSAYNNPASMLHQEGLYGMGVSITNHFGLHDLNSGSLAFVLGNTRQKMGMYYYHTGNRYFGNGSGGLSIAQRLHTSFIGGIQLAYMNIYAHNYASYHYASGSISGIYSMTSDFHAAFSLILPSALISTDNPFRDLRQQRSLALGVQHQINPNVMIQLECEVFDIFRTDYRVAAQYQASEHITLQTGFSVLQQKINYGFIYHNKLNICVAFAYHNQLGHTITSDVWIQKNSMQGM